MIMAEQKKNQIFLIAITGNSDASPSTFRGVAGIEGINVVLFLNGENYVVNSKLTALDMDTYSVAYSGDCKFDPGITGSKLS